MTELESVDWCKPVTDPFFGSNLFSFELKRITPYFVYFSTDNAA